jgi:hypothetical protein
VSYTATRLGALMRPAGMPGSRAAWHDGRDCWLGRRDGSILWVGTEERLESMVIKRPSTYFSDACRLTIGP